MDPVSQAAAASSLQSCGLAVCGWHHSHPRFPPAPSRLDLCSQAGLQRALGAACLGLITSQHWPTGRTASQYRCIRVEDEDLENEEPVGYQFSVKLVPNLNADNLDAFLAELATLPRGSDEHSVRLAKDVCPEANMTYLDKCISSMSHHMRSAGYADADPVVERLLQGVRDVLR